MKYTAKQIESAKYNYNSFLAFRTVESYNPEIIGRNTAEQRCEFHNGIVTEIKNGNKATEREWKLFFLNDQVKMQQKADASKAKLSANREASADILAPIKQIRKIVEFNKWLNSPKNKFQRQFFNKKYTQESVELFLSIN